MLSIFFTLLSRNNKKKKHKNEGEEEIDFIKGNLIQVHKNQVKNVIVFFFFLWLPMMYIVVGVERLLSPPPPFYLPFLLFFLVFVTVCTISILFLPSTMVLLATCAYIVQYS